jgi:hypothetical protein
VERTLLHEVTLGFRLTAGSPSYPGIQAHFQIHQLPHDPGSHSVATLTSRALESTTRLLHPVCSGGKRDKEAMHRKFSELGLDLEDFTSGPSSLARTV